MSTGNAVAADPSAEYEMISGLVDINLAEEVSFIKEDAAEKSLGQQRSRALSITPISPENAPTVLVWKDLTVRVNTAAGEKILLRNISGTITGGFWAIMGSSGGGKTTLLSTLSLRLDRSKMDVAGDITLNGLSYDKNDLKSMSAYVMQDDLLHPDLTVAETLDFTAKLRLSKTFTNEKRAQRIDEVLELLGIGHVRNVIVGDTRRKGISGGERKRLCIAMELLNKPALLFLDEPTSGLDSTTALSVCSSLKNLAETGVSTVVCTIHQPQQKIFELFDNIILMSRGSIIYEGATTKAIRFLGSVGITCPADVNPADFLLDVITSKTKSSDQLSQLVKDIPIDLKLGQSKEVFTTRETQNWLSQVAILFSRSVQQQTRRYDIICFNITVTILISVFVSCGGWKNIGNDQDSIKLRNPSLFFACVTQGIIAALQSTHSFPLERALSLRERAAGTYCVSAYFVAKSLGDTMFQLISPTIFSIIVYNVIGYQNKADKFFIYWMFMCLDTMAATSLATMISCLCVSLELTTVVMSVCFELCRLFGGLFITPLQMHDYPEWHFADALSYIKYCFVGVNLNELSGLELTCTSAQIASNKCISKGETLIEANGYDKYTIQFCVGILIVYIFGCRFFGYLALRYIKN